MTEKRPTKPFTLSATPQKERPKAEPQIRDKDNAQPRIQPPGGVTKPSPRMGPPGTTGIQRNLPKPSNDKGVPAKKVAKPFTLGRTGDLGKTFKPIVTKPRGKGPDFDL